MLGGGCPASPSSGGRSGVGGRAWPGAPRRLLTSRGPVALWGQVTDRLNLISGVKFPLVGWAVYSHYNISQPLPSQHPTARKGGCGWPFQCPRLLPMGSWAHCGALQTVLLLRSCFLLPQITGPHLRTNQNPWG